MIPDLIGITPDQAAATTVNYMNSKFYQTFTSIFNPVLFRDSQRRDSLAALSFTAPTYPTNHLNAYDYMSPLLLPTSVSSNCITINHCNNQRCFQN